MPNTLGNFIFPLTDEKPSCTQDNLKKMNPNDLAYYLREALLFSVSGGIVEVKISSKLLAQMRWHPYLSVLFAHFNLLEPGNDVWEHSDAQPEVELKNKECHISLRRFYDGIQQLNAMSPMGMSVRDHSLFLVGSGGAKNKNVITQTILNPNPSALVLLKDVVKKAAELRPSNMTGDNVLNELQEYQLLIVTESAHLLEEVVGSLGQATGQLKEMLEKMAFQKREELMQLGQAAYTQYLYLLDQWEKVKGRPEVEFPARSGQLKIKVSTDILKLLEDIKSFSIQFGTVLGDGCVFKEQCTKEELAIFLDKVMIQLNELSHQCHLKADDYIKRINTGNIPNPELKTLLEEVEETITEINGKQLLKQKLETNTRNFYQFYFALNQHYQKLKRALVFSKSYPEIMAWKAFTDTLDASALQIVEALKPIPVQRWVSDFDLAANELFFERWTHPAILSDEIIYQAGRNQISRWKTNAMDDLYQLKNSKLQNEKAPSSVLSRVGKWLNLGNNTKHTPEQSEPTRLFTISLTDGLGEEVKISMVSEGQDPVEHSIDVRIIESFAALGDIHKKIDDYAITDRFSIAKTVAGAILGLGCETRVFQLKNANILCLLPKPLSDAMYNELDELGIKEFQGRTSKEDAIIESLIETRRKQVMILFNGLPNDTLVDSFEEQILLLEKIKQLGFITHSVWSKDLIAKGGISCFDGLKQVLYP